VGDLATVNMEINSDLLPIHNLVCNTSIIWIELETMLSEALHKLHVLQQCCYNCSIDGIETFINQHLLATLVSRYLRAIDIVSN
jgi:hypothetical protein